MKTNMFSRYLVANVCASISTSISWQDVSQACSVLKFQGMMTYDKQSYLPFYKPSNNQIGCMLDQHMHYR